MHLQSRQAMTVTVVIPALNEAATVERTLLSCQNDSAITSVIVVDNGSSDSTSDIAKRLNATVIFVEPKNRARARNTGLFGSTSDVTLFIDSGVTFEPGSVSTLLQCLSKNQDMIACQGELLIDGTASLGSQTPTHLGYPYVDTKVLAVRTYAAQSLGGFDELLTRAEDIDFGWRLSYLGLSFAVCAEAPFSYAQGTSFLCAIQRGAETAVALITLYAKWRAVKKINFRTAISGFFIIGSRKRSAISNLPLLQKICLYLDGITTFLVFLLKGR